MTSGYSATQMNSYEYGGKHGNKLTTHLKLEDLGQISLAWQGGRRGEGEKTNEDTDAESHSTKDYKPGSVPGHQGLRTQTSTGAYKVRASYVWWPRH